MKLVIRTQYRENYGAHDWDGTGECPQYWKNKGVETYVVRNLSSKSSDFIAMNGIPNLTSLIESSNERFEEYIIDFDLTDDDSCECDEWETPWELDWAKPNWVASRTTDREEYWASDVLAKNEFFYLAKGGQRIAYNCDYERMAA
tara:strand:+ start:1208 stop:1642 length:435 start_codon:yes stop_codon:yes gene_type:complete